MIQLIEIEAQGYLKPVYVRAEEVKVIRPVWDARAQKNNSKLLLANGPEILVQHEPEEVMVRLNPRSQWGPL